MKIQIGSHVQELTSQAGKQYKKFNIKDEKGVVINDVVAFPFFSHYSEIVSGAVVEAVVKEKDYNGRTSYSLVDGNLGPKPASFGAKAQEVKIEAIKKAQDRTNESVKSAQERRESAIAISSTARDATLIVTTFYKDLNYEEIKDKWLQWRRWLLNNFDNTTGKDLTSIGDPVPTFERPVDEFSEFAKVDDINPNDIPF